MSTPGKVLVVLILLSSLVWILLMAGVDQLNRNGNQALIKLTEQVAKLQDDLQTTKQTIAGLKDQTTVMQEQVDRQLAVIQSRQNDVQRSSSAVREILARVQYELATIQETVQSAEKAKAERETEKASEEKALAALQEEVAGLKVKDKTLRDRLQGLGSEFTTIVNGNRELLEKSVK